MLLSEVLASHEGDRERLLIALTKLKNDDQKLEPDAEGLESLVALLLQAGGSGAGAEGLTLAGLLIKAAVQNVQLEEEYERLLLDSRYVPALTALLDGATATLASRAPLQLAAEEPLRLAIEALDDVATYSTGQPANGRTPKGREVHGAAVVSRLAAFLAAPPPEGGPSAGLVAARHAAAGALLEYLVNWRPNSEHLASLPESLALFGEVLPSCGDVALQVDLLEALYRCAKARVLTDAHRERLQPALREGLDVLVGRPTKGLDLAAELRRLLVTFNRALGAEATVHCAQAKSVVLSGIDGLAAPGRWVDFGLRALALGLHIPEGEEGEGGADLEILEFPYADMTRVQTSPGATSGYCKLTINLRAMPKSLQALSDNFKGSGTLVMQFTRGDLGGLVSHAPKVAAAMKAAGVAFSADGALSGGGNGALEMSQRTRKCSTGFTVYQQAQQAQQAQQPSDRPASSGRAPLHLTRSGHTPSNSTGATGAGAQLQQRPTARPKSLLQRASSPVPPPGAEEAEQPQQQEKEEAERAAAEPPAAEADGPEAGAAAEEDAAAQQPQRCTRQASQRPPAVEAAPAAGGSKQPAKQPAMRKGPQKAAGAAAAADTDDDSWGASSDEEPDERPAPAAAAAAGKPQQKAAAKQLQPRGKAAAGAAAGRRGKMQGGAAGKRDGKARRGAKAGGPAGDPIETQTQRLAPRQQAAADSPTPSWMREDGGAQGAGAPLAQGDSSGSDSDLQFDHASKQELFAKKQAAPPAAAALAAAAAKAQAAAAKAAEAEAAAAAKKEAAAAKAKAAAAAKQPAGKGKAKAAAAPAVAAKKAAGGQAGPSKPAATKAAAGKKAVGGKAGAAGGKAAGAAAGGSRQPARAAAAKASAKLASDLQFDADSDSEGEDAQPTLRQPTQRRGKAAPAAAAAAAAAKGKGKAAAVAAEEEEPLADSFAFDVQTGPGRAKKAQAAAAKRPSPAKQAVKSPLGRMQGGGRAKLAGQKREREEQAEAGQAAEEPEAEAAAPALFPEAPLPEASLPLAEEEQPGAKLASELEAELAAAPPAAEAAPEPSAGWELPAAPAEEEAAPMEGVEKEGQDAAEAAEEEGAGEEAAGEEAPEHGSSEEEQEEEPEPEAGAYRSEGTRPLAGWTHFREAEPDLPDMLVPPEELAGITKKFKFTAVKEQAAPAAAAAAAAAATAPRSKADRKAAAAAAVPRKAPEPLLGLTAPKLAAKAARLTTTLSQPDAAGPSGEAQAAAQPARGPAGRPRALQQLGKPGAGGKRALEALGQPGGGAQKRQKAGAAGKQPAGAAAAAGGRSTRKAAAAAAGLDPGSQALSIHGLLHSAQQRAAAATPPTQPDSDSEDEGDLDLTTLQALMLEMVRKRKQAAQRKQAAMLAELEGEVAAALGAKEAELAAAQRGVDEAVAGRFAQLEKQLDGKMREIDAATLAFQQKLNSLWDEYRGIYDAAATASTEAEEAATKQHAQVARGLEALREGLAAKAAEVARRIDRANKRAGKMPELAQMLAPFLG